MTRSRVPTALVIGILAASMAGPPAIAPAVGAAPVRAADPPLPIYLDTSYSFAERAADLVARLTPQQRATQLTSSQAPAISAGQNPLLTPVDAGQTTLAIPASAGDTSIITASTAGLSPGATLILDPNGTAETVTIATVGSGPSGFAASLAAPASPGDTNIKVNFTFGLTAGHPVRIDSGANQEIRTIQAVGTGGAGGTGVTLTTPLALAHATGAAVQDLGTPTTITPALTHDYPAGTTVNVKQGIPAYGWWNEALHGVSRESTAASGNAVGLTNTTSYPIDQSLGASWDPSLVYRVATAISDESREVVRNNKFDLDFYSPTINLQHDPRWGRNDESYGEDPYLVTKIVDQFVNGMEGKDQSGSLLPAGNGFYKTLTTLKHYAANNSEVNRRSGSADMDDRTLREYYTLAFRGIAGDAQPGSVMSSYNSINGIPTASDAYLIDTLMRQTFGFQGYFTSDCDAIASGIVPQHHWQPAGFPHPLTGVEALAFALAAGEDLECNAGFSGPNTYKGSTTQGGTVNAIGMNITTPNGLHTVNDLDVSATRLFTARMELGEFNPDSTVPWLTQARARVPAGSWTNNNSNLAVTETADRLALAREAADKSIVLLKNASTTRKDGSTGTLLPIQVPASGPFKVLVIGALGNNPNFYLGGYSSTQGTNGQANEVTPYAGIKAAVQAINPDATVDFLRGFTGTSNTAGNLTTVDATAVAAAANYDDVIVYTGTDSGTATEDRDRTAITLPGAQASLISQVAAQNPNTIAFMETIGPMDVSSFEPGVAALLWSSYIGQRKGEAVADVLLGAYNPSGRTNGIWYQNVSQIPAITSYSIRPVGATGRTYMYYNGPLQYPFGYGLSYTGFSYSNLVLDKHSLDANETLHASVDVTNTGSVAGNDVVELYVSTPDAQASAERPIKRLEGFQKVALDAGQTKTVTFTINVPDLAFFDDTAGKWVVDDGAYGIQVSTSSADADIQAHDLVNVTGTIDPRPSVLTAKPRIDGTDLARGISQRVMFPEGVVIDPGLTVAMNDDTLYGFVDPGQAKPFPAGMTFSYTSNRPSVVSVDGNGVLHTIANGVATVTATVTYGGVSRSTDFVVRVLSDLGDLQVNGTTVAGFNPDVFEYDVVVPDNVPPVPIVEAAAPTGTVAITQATAIPGTATVTSTGPDGLVATYHINFARASRSDEFGTDTLGPQWSFVRETPADWSLTSTPGSLVITARQGDLNAGTNTAQNVLLQPALGDWTMTSRLTFSTRPHAATQQGGIIAYGDDDNYLKFDLEATSATNIQLNTTLEDKLNGNPIAQVLNTTPANAILPADNTIWLRMSKTGPFYTTSYSVDGTTWVPVWTTGATLRDVQAGVFAFNRAGTTSDLQVAFDFFHIDGTQAAPVTFDIVANAVKAFSSDPDVTSGLLDKLTAAASAKSTKTRDNLLDAFISQVEAQTGKALTEHEAEILIALANALR